MGLLHGKKQCSREHHGLDSCNISSIQFGDECTVFQRPVVNGNGESAESYDVKSLGMVGTGLWRVFILSIVAPTI